jgi:hypothetical protein
MRRIALLLGLLAGFAFPSSPQAKPTNEVLVLTTATRIDTATTQGSALALGQRKGFELVNVGPNALRCAVGSATGLSSTVGRPVQPGEVWGPFPLPKGIPVYCLALTANQVTGAATIVTEF